MPVWRGGRLLRGTLASFRASSVPTFGVFGVAAGPPSPSTLQLPRTALYCTVALAHCTATNCPALLCAAMCCPILSGLSYPVARVRRNVDAPAAGKGAAKGGPSRTAASLVALRSAAEQFAKVGAGASASLVLEVVCGRMCVGNRVHACHPPHPTGKVPASDSGGLNASARRAECACGGGGGQVVRGHLQQSPPARVACVHPIVTW